MRVLRGLASPRGTGRPPPRLASDARDAQTGDPNGKVDEMRGSVEGEPSGARGFSGRQVIAIAVAVAVSALLVPVGARAAGSFVTIQDEGTADTAIVDANGSLHVTNGKVPIEVDGVVGSFPSEPPTPIVVSTVLHFRRGDTPLPIFPHPFAAGRTIHVSSLTISSIGHDVDATYPFSIETDRAAHGGADCEYETYGFRVRDLISFRLVFNGALHLPFPQAVPLSVESYEWCLVVRPLRSDAPSGELHVLFVGY
jgi:hypothetical protein